MPTNTKSRIIYLRDETQELLTKKDLCERVLHCDVNTAELHYINKKGFPYLMQGTMKKYPKKQVEEWINKHVRYND